jgi:hypothetical protein
MSLIVSVTTDLAFAPVQMLLKSLESRQAREKKKSSFTHASSAVQLLLSFARG